MHVKIELSDEMVMVFCDACCRTHMAPTYSALPFPRALFEKFVRENDGELQHFQLGSEIQSSSQPFCADLAKLKDFCDAVTKQAITLSLQARVN